jgi:hypothetical protein
MEGFLKLKKSSASVVMMMIFFILFIFPGGIALHRVYGT